MPGIPPFIACHKLNVDPYYRPVKQNHQTFNQERYDAIEQEVDLLLVGGFIREVIYPDWVSNVVLVKKSNGKWRMCVNFIDLNKSCPRIASRFPK